MDFRETGLPSDPLVYRAFTAYVRSSPAAPETPLHWLRVAQLLTEAGCKDNELIAFALLANQAPQLWPEVMTSLFGQRIADLREELKQQSSKLFLKIDTASDPIKVLYMAHMVSHLNLTGGVRDDMPLYVDLFNGIRGTTSSPEMEKRYLELLAKMSMEAEANQQGELPPNPEEMYPPFEEFNLPDDAAVRSAYQVVTGDSRTHPFAFEYAVNVAGILGLKTAGVEPCVVAAALIINCIPEATGDDLKKWEDTVGTEVVNILNEGSPDSPRYNLEIEYGSEKFKQAALAHSIIKLNYLLDDLEWAASLKAPVNLDKAKALINKEREYLQPALGHSGSYTLDKMFQKSLADSVELIARFEKKRAPKPPFSPPKPKF